jgi:hypothetical protein
LFSIGLCLTFTLSACATTGKAVSSAKITLTPDKTVLSPVLIKKPIQITSTGWKPNEPVVVNLKVPEGVTIKGAAPGEDVGIAGGTADGQGVFKSKIDALTILMTFFQVGWDNIKMKPDFKKATPLRPGTYTVEAIGFESEARATTTLTLLPPPKKKK